MNENYLSITKKEKLDAIEDKVFDGIVKLYVNNCVYNFTWEKMAKYTRQIANGARKDMERLL